MSSTPIVVALGGNALLRRGEPTDATTHAGVTIRASIRSSLV
jgi:carbamate kinase